MPSTGFFQTTFTERASSPESRPVVRNGRDYTPDPAHGLVNLPDALHGSIRNETLHRTFRRAFNFRSDMVRLGLVLHINSASGSPGRRAISLGRATPVVANVFLAQLLPLDFYS